MPLIYIIVDEFTGKPLLISKDLKEIEEEAKKDSRTVCQLTKIEIQEILDKCLSDQ